MHTKKRKNSNNLSNTRVAHCYVGAVESAKRILFSYLKKGIYICTEISIALYLSIFAPEFERAFDNANSNP